MTSNTFLIALSSSELNLVLTELEFPILTLWPGLCLECYLSLSALLQIRIVEIRRTEDSRLKPDDTGSWSRVWVNTALMIF